MRKPRILGAAIAAVLIVAVTWSLLRGEPPSADGQARDQTRRELAALRAELNSLRASNLGVARAALERAATKPEPDVAADRPTARGEPSAAPDKEAAAAKQRMPGPVELAAQIDGKFAAEQADPAWSAAAARLANEALSSTLPAGTTLGHVECHASLCRVESFHTDRDAYRSFVDASFLSRDKKLWNGASTSIVIDDSQAGIKAVSFIAREGKDIPAMEPIDG